MLITPLDIWMKVVASQLERSNGVTEVQMLQALAPFQADGARAVIAALDRYGGALLCDSPGLGKTYVALAVAANRDPLFVLPAALVPTWRRTAASLGISIRWVTHESLSRGNPAERAGSGVVGPSSKIARAPDQPGPGGSATLAGGGKLRADESWAGLVVVDEAHRFRNPLARGYRWLASLCAGRRVLLVTATPVNNREEDLYHLLRLFAGDASFASAGVPDLREAFRPGSLASGDLTRVLDEIVVRRTRDFLEAELSFPSRQSTVVPVSLSDSDAFGEIAALLRHHASSSPLFVFLLAKRLASSPHAFLRTLQRLKSGNARADLDEEGGAQALLPFGTREDASADVAPLLPFATQLAELPDTKAARLRELVLSGEAGERTVVFTEYRDTASALWRALRDLPRTAMLHGSGGRTACGEASRAQILERFAPAATGRPGLAPHEELRLLIATDVLSEGLNLQDADGVVSYDLPWNPVRLAQRAGRIDRIGSRHRQIRVVEFPPDPELDSILRLTERLARKERAIAATTGAEAGRAGLASRTDGASKDALADAVVGGRRTTSGAAGIQMVGRASVPGRCFDSVVWTGTEARPTTLPGDRREPWMLGSPAPEPRSLLLRETRRLVLGAPLALARTARLPDGALAALRHNDGCVLACCLLPRTGSLEFVVLWPDGPSRHVSRSAGLCLLASVRHLPAAPLPDAGSSWRRRLDICAGRLAARLESVAGAGCAIHSAGARRLVALVQRAERASRDDAARLARLESLERRLAAPLDAGTHCRLRDIAGPRPGPGDLDRLLPLLEAALPAEAAPKTGAAGLRLLGAVLIHSSLVQSITREVSKRSAQSLCDR